MVTLRHNGPFIKVKKKFQTTPVLFSSMTMINYENVHKEIVSAILNQIQIIFNSVTITLVYGWAMIKQISVHKLN